MKVMAQVKDFFKKKPEPETEPKEKSKGAARTIKEYRNKQKKQIDDIFK